jgi:hypothetical protein
MSDVPIQLSASTNGAAIVLGSNSASPTLLHTATNDPAQKDHFELFASNDHTADVQVYFTWAGQTEKGPLIPFQKGPFRLYPPRPIWGGATITAWADVPDVIHVWAGSASTRSSN